MSLKELEVMLEATLAVTRPTRRDVRDALVDYFVAVARPFLRQGLAYTDPAADERQVNRLLRARLQLLWKGLDSSWDDPSLEALSRFRKRIEEFACVGDGPEQARARRLLDELMIAAAVAERMISQQQPATHPRPALRVIAGGGEITPPRGGLRIVSDAPTAGQ